MTLKIYPIEHFQNLLAGDDHRLHGLTSPLPVFRSSFRNSLGFPPKGPGLVARRVRYELDLYDEK